ncbi:MAG: peptidase C69 [Deltaproteobacteria bacterium RIFCSPLOWO2_02_FULL_53_8]|nr:MAG: peptidase C69 [Deltaproteobacteria bacterium RIFCSPLOWO2_02_FULL_53_8]
MSIINFDPFKVIKAALYNGGDFADIYVEESINTSIVCEERRIERVTTGRDRGAGIRVIANLKTYYAYTNDLTEAGLLEVAAVVAKGVASGRPLPDVGPVKRLTAAGFKILKPPAKTALSDKASIVKRANAAAWAFDSRIQQVKVIYGDGTKAFAVVNSLGEWIEEERTGMVFICQVVAKDGDVIQTGYEPVGGTAGLEMLDETTPETAAQTAAGRAIQMLGAARAPGGMMPVVLGSDAGGTMVHEAVGHGLESDLALGNLSVYSGKVGQTVAAPIITVIDDSTIPFKRGSFFFDDEGSAAQRSVLVENGVLKSYMYDRLGAMKAGTTSTGNGRRESYHYRPIARMTNTIIAPGKTDPASIIASVETGLYVKKMGGGQVNTVNGDFVFEVTEGYMIEKGKVGEPVRGATLTGNGPEVLMKIDMVGSDLGFGIGTCGKDGQGVPVADAQPTLRIPEITVGGAG